MFLSLFTDELNLDFYEALPLIKEWGLQAVDFRGRVNGKSIANQTKQELLDLKKVLDSEGLVVGALQSSLCKVHLPDEAAQRQEQDKLEGLIRAADILDCRLIRSFNYWQLGETDPQLGDLAVRPDMMNRVLELFEPIRRRAVEAGLQLSFENCGQTPDEVIALLDALNTPGWGMAFDCANMFDILPEASGDATAYFTKCIYRANMIHVKARATLDVFEKWRNVPWARVLRAVSALPQNIPVSIETHNPAGSPWSPIECTKLCIDAIRRAWPSAAPTSVEAALEPQPAFVRPYADDPVRFVVVGLGMGKNRARQLTETSGIALYGVCDIDREKARATGAQYGVPWSDDINFFLNDPAVEVMYVVTPTGRHCSVAMQCLKAGKHVLTTKPMDVDVQSCDAAIALAREKGLLLGVDFDERHRLRFLEQKTAMENGFFGRVHAYNVNLYIRRDQAYYNENGKWRGTWALDGGGSLCNQGVHEVDRALLLLGMPRQVRARIATQNHDIETEDAGITEWLYDSDIQVRFASTTNYPLGSWYVRIEIHGTDGAYVYTSGGPEGEHSWWGRQGSWTETCPFKVEQPWRQGSDNFAYSVRTGAPLDICGEQGRLSRLILDALYKSAQDQGHWVAVDS
jgi:predicted dehydrogenase/sugar phosphate isomerase/epimerase